MQRHQVSYPKCKACSLGRLLPAPHLEHWTPVPSHVSISPVTASREGFCEAKLRLTLSSVAAVQSSPAQAIPIPLRAGGRRGVQCCTAGSGGERSAGGGGQDRRTGSHM